MDPKVEILKPQLLATTMLLLTFSEAVALATRMAACPGQKLSLNGKCIKELED